jgi:hypothetical protein
MVAKSQFAGWIGMAQNVGRKSKGRSKLASGMVVGLLSAGCGSWFTLSSTTPWAKATRLWVGGVTAPLITPALPEKVSVTSMSLSFPKGQATGSEPVPGELTLGRKSFDIEVVSQPVGAMVPDGLVTYDATSSKAKGVDGLSHFVISQPLSASQTDEYTQAELGALLEINDGLEVRPVVFTQDGTLEGLRYVSELPTPARLTKDSSRLKLLCRAAEQTQADIDAIQGVDKSKLAVRPHPSWSLFSATLGEGVNAPEFQFLVASGEKIATGQSLNDEESKKLFRLLSLDGFAKYVAIRKILGDTDTSMVTPPSFSFDATSGTIRPSTSLCDAGGVVPRKDAWFGGILSFLASSPEYAESLAAVHRQLSSEPIAESITNLKNRITKEIGLIANASPRKYRVDKADRMATGDLLSVEFTWNAGRRVAEAATLMALELAITGKESTDAEQPVRASMGAGDYATLPSIHGTQTLDKDIVVGKGQSLTVEAGTSLSLAADVSLVVNGGEIVFAGTAEKPITIKAAEGLPWGALIVAQSGKAKLSHTRFERGSEAYRDFVRYDGMLSAHNANLEVENCSFIDGIVSLVNTKAKMSRVEFANVLSEPFLSQNAFVLAKALKHTKLAPSHQKQLADVKADGEPHHEREFKYALDVAWNSTQLKQSAEELQKQFAKVLAEPGKWKAPQYAKGNYRADSKVSEAAYLDVYLDTPAGDAFKNDVSYRYRNRFQSRIAHDAYLTEPWVPANWPFRLEYQAKIGRGHSEPGFHEVFEARFEFRKQTPPFGEQHLAPWSPWDLDVFLPLMQTGTFNNIPTVSGKGIYEYLSQKTGKSSFAFEPRVVVVTERLRQHLNLPTEWGSGPNPEQCNIITLDRTEIYDAKDYLEYMRANKYGEPRFEKPKSFGIFTEMEVEFERNVSRELDNSLEAAKLENNAPEVKRLESARDAFVDDLRTLRKEIVDYYATKSIRVYPAEESKFLQAVKVRDADSSVLPAKQQSHRLTLDHAASSADIRNVSDELQFDTTGKGMKFIFSANQVLVVNDRTHSANHQELGRGRDVQTAGYIAVPDKTKPLSFKLTNQSGSFCPSVESLEAVKAYLIDRGGADVHVDAISETSETCGN